MLKRKMVYLLTLIVVFFCNVYFLDYQPFAVLIIMLCLPFVLYIHIILIRQFVDVTMILQENMVVRGDKSDFVIRVNNKGILPAPNVTIVVTYKYCNCDHIITQSYNVSAKEMHSTRITGTIVMNYCGNVDISLANVYCYDLIRLFKVKIKCNQKSKIMVMPKLNEPDYYTIYTPNGNLFDARHYSQKNSGDDSSEIFDVREYQQGDRISRIHWKITAKEDKMFVKEFSLPISTSSVILLELFSGTDEEERKNLDGVYELAYAIGHFACMREKQYKLVYYSMESQSIKMLEVESEDMLSEAIKMIIKEKAYNNYPYALNEFRMAEIFNCEKLYYITSQITDEVSSFIDQSGDENSYVYCIGDESMQNNSVENEGTMIMFVDRNDIKQGLKTIMI